MTNLPRFSLTLDDDLLEKVEQYQSDNGFSTRNKAIVDLIAAGINDINKDEEPRLSPLQLDLIRATESLSDDDLHSLIFIAKRLGRS